MYKVHIKPHWEIAYDNEAALDTANLLTLLTAIQQSGSIAQASQQIRYSYRHAWGLLRDAERIFGNSLIDSGRGRGTTLTDFANKLLWADRLVAARLSPTLDSLASELEIELGKTVEGKSETVRLNASHGFAVAALLGKINEARLPVEVRYRHSTDAVAALSRQECDLAGFHVPLGEFEKPAIATYAKWLNKRSDCLIHLAVRAQGLFVEPGNPKNVQSLADLTRPDLRFVNREAGSGTRMLLELMLSGQGIAHKKINGFENTEFTHSAVAAFIASGMADVGFGVQTASQRFGLEFIPLVRERYFFALPAASLHDPLIRAVIDILQSESFRTAVNGLAGYDATDTGKIQTLKEAFG
ncbi:substrate-binding domain-containing protein [Herbaspirillum robiniae]|uniref:Helix-turn-helix transcriptional regulator n=1 Tax=Herbaspirillum robiniae TaxID=2014887 RepID=A0A246WQQ9_9BURK|nr:substrate-binding domain-containing protein [Herbaspirillum robiniae]NUU02262.1 helix-turn-helix transcriptional regulator [Herbaspirillum robiniae]OWY28739.1 LysR family transcriptional regulator [Herbaspirillum robiniae]